MTTTPTDALREEILAQRDDLLEWWWGRNKRYPFWCPDCKTFNETSTCSCGEKGLEQVKP